ncbi:Uncharacterized protein PECH_005342 [Penicillium ucsense]|uniref:Uncharacterized protein n=1 Tax=Penicillium ucsense TaxID=2839758 RepID=A0A8J8WKB3_9EURO|nr:Uncharacterized protein PECM_004090 [Penicillium ucsense]KAF7736369.1 Uncharacterized protein PECH_005342 [Penicillium ucsense]
MATAHATHRESWDSLSSTFAHLEVSFSQDSCYGSDEVSVTSNKPAPLQSSVETFIEKRPPTLHPFLKSILKTSTSDAHDASDDSESESGYGSDDIEFEYDALSEGSEGEDDDEDDDMSDFSVWEETSEVPETREDRTDTFDDDFIAFEPSVRFATDIEYIDSSDLDMADDEDTTEPQMTCHEMMMLALKSGSLSSSVLSDDHRDDDDEEQDEQEPRQAECTRAAVTHPEDFSPDNVDVDRQLFIAYMNGIHGIADAKYKAYIQTQADNVRLGNQTESMHPDDAHCMYLDLIQSHVIGVFPNLLSTGELDTLLELRKQNVAGLEAEPTAAHLPSSPHRLLLDKVEHLLEHRLAIGRIKVLPDEMSFLAGGVIQALDAHESHD